MNTDMASICGGNVSTFCNYTDIFNVQCQERIDEVNTDDSHAITESVWTEMRNTFCPTVYGFSLTIGN